MSEPPSRPSLISRLFVFTLTSGAVAAAGWWYLHRDAGAGQAKASSTKGPVPIIIAKTAKDNFATDVEAIGTVQAFESTDIMPNVTETITSLHFEDGQRVKKGDLLATLSNAEEQALLSSAKSSLAEEEREIRRLDALVKEGAAPEAKLQERQTMAEVARQKIREAEARLADRKITAPFDGVLGLRRISVGALVSPTTIITTLDKIDVVKIDFSVPEVAIPHLKKGIPIAGMAAAAGNKTFTGKLSQLDSRIDPITRSVSARAEVENPGAELKPGMLVLVKISTEPRLSLAIPERALVPVGAKTFVFTVDGEKARRLEVKAGRRKPGKLEVLDGLSEGQIVITDGLVGLLDGAAVKVAREFAGPAKAFTPEQSPGSATK